MKETSPAHQHYPAEFLAETYHMDAEAIGAYILLRGVCWSNGSIPTDWLTLARMSKIHPKRIQKVFGQMSHLFTKNIQGWTHFGMESEREKQAKHRENKQLAGRAGAAKRWQRHTSAIVLPMAEGMAENGSSSLSLSSSVVSVPNGTNTHTQRRVALNPGYSSKRFQEWLNPWPRCASEEDACRVWISTVESPEDEEKAFKARDRYLVSSEVQRGAVMDPAKFLMQQKHTRWTGRWPMPTANKQQQLVERIKNL